ncbi:hypothetical protein HOL21_01605 [Candidatus Woesearchaeota archaeon]|jgi:predicted transcriptional regulator|nr:hypothetical protein [Candidatus Woesearchaeota archaeon]MBT5396888.1 hypothetical protein [Candidatus Woesearchaeota archaeon]MBT5924962.1 hypothetical protein [Candidatus Woesearchaeota archaeon]MBT6367081.1 hypothetical protein [Candidatus Woesearchaeota archaeon]MBT7762345.1 hypothetical protein [Candidatus Woesearchaeota archaeon]
MVNIKTKKLIFPQEIEVWYILPAIRKKIAMKLIEGGMPQKDVADIMYVTPAAISQYKKAKRAKEDFFDAELEDELVKSVKTITKDHTALAKEIIRLSTLTKKKGIVCTMYKTICALGKGKENGTCPYCKVK